MRTGRALLVVLMVAAGAACAEAGGDPTGGELTPAGQQAVTPPAFVADGVAIDCGPSTSSTWSDLYRDIFATGKPGSCTFRPTCHGSPGGDDAHQQFECTEQDTCRKSLASRNLAGPKNKNGPLTSNLIQTIRKRNAAGALQGIMPQQPANDYFPQTCIDRIAGWIANGAPAD